MFFTLSKLFWFVASPINALILGGVLAGLLSFTRFARPARWLGLACACGLVLLALSPLPRILARPLEDRFPQKRELTGRVDGIIVLGGGIGLARGDVRFTSAASRMTKALELSRRHPEAKVVFSGGGTNLIRKVTITESDAAKAYFIGNGLAPERLLLEDRSRNTWENASFTTALVAPKPGERWLLVTSAWHMPRAVGVFRKAGFGPVEPFPVDYTTSGEASDLIRPFLRAPVGLDLADDTLKEWAGLVAYRWAGYTDTLFPAP
ncbi:MAG: YdcF family protein [Bosea sp. (in: a-proteobacteria)]